MAGTTEVPEATVPMRRKPRPYLLAALGALIPIAAVLAIRHRRRTT